jgi:hypothetical protein
LCFCPTLTNGFITFLQPGLQFFIDAHDVSTFGIRPPIMPYRLSISFPGFVNESELLDLVAQVAMSEMCLLLVHSLSIFDWNHQRP